MPEEASRTGNSRVKINCREPPTEARERKVKAMVAISETM